VGRGRWDRFGLLDSPDYLCPVCNLASALCRRCASASRMEVLEGISIGIWARFRRDFVVLARRPGAIVQRLCKIPAGKPGTQDLEGLCFQIGRNGAPGEIRTPGLLVRSQTLYPAELRAHSCRFWKYSTLRPRFREEELQLLSAPNKKLHRV
jgi:hypothetical protein